jgi:hypothetical protein
MSGPVGNEPGGVFTVHYKELAAVVSQSSEEKYNVCRENTIAHQKVLEEVLVSHPLLPVRFGTVAQNEEIVKKFLLQERYAELRSMLHNVTGKVQMGLKVLWTDMKTVYQEIVEENPQIKNLKKKLESKPAETIHYEMIDLGQMVNQALLRKKEKQKEMVLKPLQKIALETKESFLYGDQMFVNADFLISRSSLDDFNAKVNELGEFFNEQALFKYIGPLPPYNFVTLYVNF